MASSYSTDLKLELMVTGEKAGLWGDITNTNLNLVQQAIAGFESISIAGGAQTTTLVMTDATLSNARNAVIKLTGTITGNQVVTIPTGIEKTYIVSNGTVGAFTVEFKQAGGTGTTFSTTDKGIKILFADGTNIVDVNANFSASSFEQINLPTQNELRFEDSTGGQYVALKAGATVASNLTFTLPTADGSANQALVTNGSGVLSFADAGLAWQSVVTTSTITVVAGRAYFINTTSAACTVTLPSGTPTAGAQVQLVDYAGTADINPIIINPNGNKIEGATDNLALNGEREGVILTFIDATQGWLATSGINEGTDALGPEPYSVDFLVIAGGGGGGSTPSGQTGAGGGGAGGYRTSTGTSGGGGSAEAKLTFNVGTVYTVTVGAGGAGGASVGNNRGGDGVNSSISGSNISTITSTGGGGGGFGGGTASSGNAGGSGGGGGAGTSAGGTAGSGTANQGRNGGAGGFDGDNLSAGGGGGGANTAGSVGGNANGNGGVGGSGLASSITGPSVTRAGGGGGGSYTGSGGAGGSGSGGAGSSYTGSGSAAPANTGSGGGGGGQSGGGAGGKGVVILRIPTADYSGTTTGSPTVTTDGSDKVIVFNDSGTITG